MRASSHAAYRLSVLGLKRVIVVRQDSISIHHPDTARCEWCEAIERVPGWVCVGVSDGGHAAYAARVGDERVYVFDGLGPETEPSYIAPTMFDLLVDLGEEFGPDPLA